MARFQEIVTDQTGAAIPGAFITVRDYPSGALTALTTDAGTAKANPITADGVGAYYFNAPAGLYTLEFRLVANEVVRKVREIDLSTGAPISASFAPPAFTNSAYSSNVQYLTNGATPGTWYNTAFAGNNATEVLTAAIVVPATATNLQTNAVAAYIRSDRAQVSGGGDVALFSIALSDADNAAVFTFNFVGIDAAGKTGQTLQGEIDYNARGNTNVNGVVVTIVSADGNPLTGTRIAFNANSAFDDDSQWNIGYQTTDGSISQYAFSAGAVSATSSTNRDSQPIALVSYKNDNTRYISTILGDHLGGMAIRAGAAGGSIAFQDPTGAANWASVDSTGLNLQTGSVLKVNTVQIIGARNTGWTADTGTAKKTANATYGAGTTLTYSAGYVQAEQTAMATRMAAVEAALQSLSQTQKSIKDALIAHGLIGT